MNAPTPPKASGGVPVLGHSLEFARDREALFHRGQREHGDVFAIQLANKRAAVVSGAAQNAVFFRETDHALNISKPYGFLKAAVGEVLLTAPPDAYQNQRPILQETFNARRTRMYVSATYDAVRAWLDALPASGTMNITEEMLNLTQQVAGRALIGPRYTEELGDEFWEEYLHVSRSLDPLLPPWLPLPKFRRRDVAQKRLRKMLAPVIQRRRDAPDKYDDLITHLLETPLKDGTKMNDELITSYFIGLLFAGHETTAGQAAWTVIQLLQHPTYLAAATAEIDEVLADATPDSGEVLRKLRHVYWAIDETTRLCPSAEIQIRIADKELEVGGYRVPEGWLVFTNAANSHFAADAFTDADQYDPLRFSPERKEGQGYAIIGFGGGVHKCTGMNFAKNEMAIISSLLLHEFDVSLLTKDVTIVRGLGSNRPSDAILRYARRAQASEQATANA